MHWFESPSFSDKVLSKVQRQNQDDIGDKLAREAWVIGAGLTNGIAEGATKSLEDPEGTAARLGLSIGIGVALGAAQRTAGLGRLAAEAVATGFGLAFAFDALTPKRWDAAQNALIDTWNSPEHTDRNALVISDHLGRFVFDTGMTMAGTLGGAKAGQFVMRRFQPPVVSGSHPSYPTGEPSAWASHKFTTMPMSASEVAAVQAGKTPVEPIIVRLNGAPSNRVSAYENLAAESRSASVVTDQSSIPTTITRTKSKSPVRSMPAVTGMRDGGNGTTILELADGTTVTTKTRPGA